MLDHSVFRDISIEIYKCLRGVRNSQNSMLAFQWETLLHDENICKGNSKHLRYHLCYLSTVFGPHAQIEYIVDILC